MAQQVGREHKLLLRGGDMVWYIAGEGRYRVVALAVVELTPDELDSWAYIIVRKIDTKGSFINLTMGQHITADFDELYFPGLSCD